MRSEIVTVVLSGALGLGGLVLVFLGLVLSTLSTLLRRDTRPGKEIGEHARLAWALVGLLALSLSTAGLALAWLNGVELYWVTIGMFSATLASVLLASVWATVVMTRR